VRGFAYGRLSRDEDSEQESLKNQEDLVVGFMSKYNHIVVEIGMDDNYTGMNFDRPGIKRMFELARNGEIDAVFVKDLRDRRALARSKALNAARRIIPGRIIRKLQKASAKHRLSKEKA
jgi:DNA invertase Pin-like site-specific DNA recombinase